MSTSIFAADKEFEDLCFEFGVELDDIVSVVKIYLEGLLRFSSLVSL